jgi:hypothetical protein
VIELSDMTLPRLSLVGPTPRVELNRFVR